MSRHDVGCLQDHAPDVTHHRRRPRAHQAHPGGQDHCARHHHTGELGTWKPATRHPWENTAELRVEMMLVPLLAFFTQACRTALKKEAKGSKFEVVLHDGAPNVGGAWSNEAYTQVLGECFYRRLYSWVHDCMGRDRGLAGRPCFPATMTLSSLPLPHPAPSSLRSPPSCSTRSVWPPSSSHPPVAL